LVLSSRVDLPVALVTVIADTVPERLRVLFPHAQDSAMRVTGNGWKEEIVAAGIGAESDARLRNDALLAAWSEQHGQLVEDGRVAPVSRQ
jgi:hypothetical protein